MVLPVRARDEIRTNTYGHVRDAHHRFPRQVDPPELRVTGVQEGEGPGLVSRFGCRALRAVRDGEDRGASPIPANRSTPVCVVEKRIEVPDHLPVRCQPGRRTGRSSRGCRREGCDEGCQYQDAKDQRSASVERSVRWRSPGPVRGNVPRWGCATGGSMPAALGLDGQRRRQFAVGIDLRQQFVGLLLDCGDGVSASDESERRRHLVCD